MNCLLDSSKQYNWMYSSENLSDRRINPQAVTPDVDDNPKVIIQEQPNPKNTQQVNIKNEDSQPKAIPTESEKTQTADEVTSKKNTLASSHFYLPTEEPKEDEDHFIDTKSGEKWIRCQNPFCGKWRYVPNDVEMPTARPWFCIMNTWDRDIASCSYPQLNEGFIVTKKKEEPEKPWMPKKECHFEKLLPESNSRVC